MSNKYYIKLWNGDIIGPFSFRDAKRRQDEISVPCEILAVVVDVSGKEVR